MNDGRVARMPATPAAVFPGRTHIAFLDGTRGFAALFVCVSHVWFFHQSEAAWRAEHLFRSLMDCGHAAVNVFIVLSGYCLMLSFLSGKPVDIRNFYLTRACRILPPYFLCLVVSAVLGLTLFKRPTGSFWDLALPVRADNFLAHVFLIHDWFASTTSKINYVLWSIGVEWKIYFLFPVLVWLGRRIGFVKTAMLTYVLTFVLWDALYERDWLNPGFIGSSVYYLGLFSGGMATAVWIAK